MSDNIRLHEYPEPAPGCYVMHFYCKYINPAHPRTLTMSELYMVESDQVETRTAAIRQIRESGWKYHSDGTATCNLCVAALKAKEAQP